MARLGLFLLLLFRSSFCLFRDSKERAQRQYAAKVKAFEGRLGQSASAPELVRVSSGKL